MGKVKYSVTYEVDQDFLCDEETIKKDFDGSWQKWIDWMAKEDSMEVITGFGGYPISIDVISSAPKET